MIEKAEIAQALKKFIRATVDIQGGLFCKVKEVDGVKNVCKCEPINGQADIYNVAIIADPSKKGFILLPKINSVVLVSFTLEGAGYVSMVSEVSEVKLAGDNFGGIAKTADLATRFNNIETKINQLVAVFAAWVPMEGDGGTALKAAITAWYGATLTSTTQAMISNTVVKHGDGN
jgi:hypothetical protein